MAIRALVAGNWKMNMLAKPASSLAGAVASGTVGFDLDVVLCPPATAFASARAALGAAGVALGGQDCHAEASGAFTGDLSADMLADAGCSYVIVGHSERRAGHGESDAAVRGKATAAHRAGLVAIVCVGETEAERDAGRAEAVVEAQLRGSLPDGATAGNTVVAYEPVWAIGTGRTPSLEDIAAMHAHMRRVVGALLATGADVRLLYGGSVKPGNAAEILAVADVNGALVGGASLTSEDFVSICGAAAGA